MAMGWLGFLLAAVTVAVWQGAHGMGVNQAVNVGRTVADIAENIGRWASKYGGVHVRTLGANAALPGNFLTRSMYAGSPADASTLGGTKTMAEARVSEREAMARLEAYHWKNPALIQREVADVIGESGGRVRYRMTARTVLNPNNAANDFELEAMAAIEGAFAKASAEAGEDAKVPVSGAGEYWTVRNGRVHYARAVVAQASCLKCHDTLDKAPEFLKTNTQFNGGGGFGYVAGRPVGVISVTVPMTSPGQAWMDSMGPAAWGAWAVAALAAVGLAMQLLRRRA
jgi:Protein of unknown function (DUF3365)